MSPSTPEPARHPAVEPASEPPRRLDLRGVGCPLNYVKTRVALDRVGAGGCVEVWLDHGEPAENVPRSAEEDGFAVVAAEAVDGEPGGGYVRVVIRRP